MSADRFKLLLSHKGPGPKTRYKKMPDGTFAPVVALYGESDDAGSSVIGNLDDAPWDMVSSEASLVAILKRIALNTATIADNTDTQ